MATGTDAEKDEVVEKIKNAVLDIVAKVPKSLEPSNSDPEMRVKELIRGASIKAAAVSGTLALPPGPLGMLTIFPDLVAIWHIQAQMVADIAAAHGKSAKLTQETMIYCLFKHAVAQGLRDVVTRVGERFIVRRATLRALQATAQKVGVKVTQRVIGKGISRWLPVIGAVGVAGYAFYDTAQVGAAAAELFGADIEVEG